MNFIKYYTSTLFLLWHEASVMCLRSVKDSEKLCILKACEHVFCPLWWTMSHNTATRLKSVFFVAEHMATETKYVIVLEINEEHSVQIKKYTYIIFFFACT
jgi:hypothetical protein